jgi:hypothetical protein
MDTLGGDLMDNGVTQGSVRGATRRQVLWTLGSAALAAAAPAAPPYVDTQVVARNDAALERLLRAQVTDPAHPRFGGVPDEYGMFHAGTAGSLIETAAASWTAPQSKHHAAPEVLERIRHAAAFLERSQSTEGNIDLLSTNFNSPPDTGFVVHNVGTAAALAKMYGAEEMLRALRPFLVKAAGGMTSGGIHTPNHRWVVSSALAQVNDVFPDAAYTRRIGQWLAEGIDIDEDGQFIERSTITYNTVTDRAFTVMAAKLKRPELLDPVRRNLHAMMYLLHPDGEVVTEVSKRQDQFVRGTMAGYWFPLNYLAVHDGDRQLAALARGLPPETARLSTLLEYPELAGPLPPSDALPEDYEKWFGAVGLARIRRGRWDATMVLQESSRFFSARNGKAVIQAVRFASSFFGKGQFIPDNCVKEGTKYRFTQSLSAPYYQPLTPPQKVDYKNWGALRSKRRQTQVCKLEQTATVEEHKGGFDLRLQSNGTPGVPVAVEISLREGGDLQGCRPAPNVADAWLLEKEFATYRVGGDTVRFGPGAAVHLLTQLRGAEAKLPGQGVYLTGYTPFDHTLRFEFQ